MKHLVVLSMFLLLASGARAQVNLDSLLIAHWQLNGDATDVSGNGFHGTIQGPLPGSDALGDPMGAYAFDGIDDHIAMPVLWSTAPDSLTVTTWFNVSDTLPEAKLVYHGDNGEFQVFTIADTVIVAVHLQSAWQFVRAGFTGEQWHFVAARWGQGEQLSVYLDGAVMASMPVPAEALVDVGSGYQASLGSYNRTVAYFYQGLLDEVRVYGRVLTDEELDSLYAAPFASIDDNGRMEELTLFPSWPNPVNGTATIAFQVHRTQPITLRLYDARGAMVHELANGRHVPGRYAFTYDTSPLKAGSYRWELRSGTIVRTQGMVVE